MEKTNVVAYSVQECRNRLANVKIGYTDLGGDVYKFNSVQKKGENFSFFATATLKAEGDASTEVTLVLSPDEGMEEPANADEIYDKFVARFFNLLGQPAADDFASAAKSEEKTANDENEQGPRIAGADSQYCENCGALISAKAVICPKCGCAVKGAKRLYEEEKSSAVGILAIVFSLLGGWLGLALGIFGLVSYYKDPKYVSDRRNCKIAIGFFIAWVVGYIILIVVSIAMPLIASGMSGLSIQ